MFAKPAPKPPAATFPRNPVNPCVAASVPTLVKASVTSFGPSPKIPGAKDFNKFPVAEPTIAPGTSPKAAPVPVRSPGTNCGAILRIEEGSAPGTETPLLLFCMKLSKA